MKSWFKFALAAVAIFGLAIAPWAIATVYADLAGNVVQGEVIAKREAFLFPGADSWDHLFEISYRYRPIDSAWPETGAHRVDRALFRRLQVGSSVSVRYIPWRLLRSVVGVGSFVAESSAWSRIGFESLVSRGLAGVANLGVILLLAVLGCLGFPALFWAWRRAPEKNYGWILSGMIVLLPVAVYWRVPRPTSLPPEPRRNATAIVRQIRVVDEIWTNAETGKSVPSQGGQRIGTPFDMLDLEFTPEGTHEPLHVLDRVDADSVPGLREGAPVPISYSIADPDAARMQAGTRHFARDALFYLLGITYGLGVLLTFVLIPVLRLLGKIWRANPVLRFVSVSLKAARDISGPPTDELHRK